MEVPSPLGNTQGSQSFSIVPIDLLTSDRLLRVERRIEDYSQL